MIDLTDAELVTEIANSLIGEVGAPGKRPETKVMEVFYDVYCLDMEIGSGASFEQFFRWSSKEQVDRILIQLEAAGLSELTETVSVAIEVAFPGGVPSESAAYEECTYWSEEQENKLTELYEKEVNIHALIERKLADYARKHNLILQK